MAVHADSTQPAAKARESSGYQISEHRSSTDDEDDEDEVRPRLAECGTWLAWRTVRSLHGSAQDYVNPAKKIPTWAEPENLRTALENQTAGAPPEGAGPRPGAPARR